jgi:hypothetical protein
MSGAYGRIACRVMLGKPEGRKGLADLGTHDMIILKWIVKKQWDRVNWIHLAEGRDRW